MRHWKRSILTILGSTALASIAGAQGYAADFEAPTYALGQLEGQGIWTNWTGVNTSHTQVVNTENSTPGGSQSIQINNGGDTVADFDALPNGSFDSGRWNIRIQSLVPAGSLGSNEFLVMNAWDLAGVYEWNGWLTLNASVGMAQAHTPNGVLGVPLVFDEWTEIRYEYDLDANNVDVYYDDVLIDSYDPRCGTTGGCGVMYSGSFIDALDLYPDPGTNPTPCYFDDLVVEPGGPVDLGTAYCFGDGSGTACPCGNSGGTGQGCANTSGSGGLLDALGSTSVALDDGVFTGHNLLPNQPGLLFFGDNQIAGGNGALFGDGLRCAGNNVIRRGTMSPDANGEASWGPGLLAGTSVVAGDTKYWQLWYRDPAGGGTCGSAFNLTNALTVSYTP